MPDLQYCCSVINQHDSHCWLLSCTAALHQPPHFFGRAPSPDVGRDGGVGAALSCTAPLEWVSWGISLLYWLLSLLSAVRSLFIHLATRDWLFRPFNRGRAELWWLTYGYRVSTGQDNSQHLGLFTPGHLRRKLSAQLLHSCLGQVCPMNAAMCCLCWHTLAMVNPYGAEQRHGGTSTQQGARQLCEPGKLPQLSPWPLWAKVTRCLDCNHPYCIHPYHGASALRLHRPDQLGPVPTLHAVQPSVLS